MIERFSARFSLWFLKVEMARKLSEVPLFGFMKCRKSGINPGYFEFSLPLGTRGFSGFNLRFAPSQSFIPKGFLSCFLRVLSG